ncbi:DUF2637 domain-containing protein [Nonomuraea terrae]|uniref:DUF2637 domain-containing protein n=1 Tax=Nonomuraea terrae TaxID=2530383 RepID=UPI0037890CBE
MIRWSTTFVVVVLAGVAAVVSYRHAYEVIVANGETGWVAYLVPLTIDGLIFASSMVMLDAARRGLGVPWLARVALVLGIAATLAANVMHGWANGPIGAIVAAWPAVALVLSYELLMGLIRRTAAVPATVGVSPTVEPESVTSDTLQVHAPLVPAQVEPLTLTANRHHGADLDEPAPEVEVQPDLVPEADPDAPYKPVAVATFLAEVTQGEPPTVRTIKDRLNVGTDRARRLKAYLDGLVAVTQ